MHGIIYGLQIRMKLTTIISYSVGQNLCHMGHGFSSFYILQCHLCFLFFPNFTEVEMMKERFAKLLLGEDMSGGGKGVCTALAISNAITNLSG